MTDLPRGSYWAEQRLSIPTPVLKHGPGFDVELAAMALARLHNFTVPTMDAPHPTSRRGIST